MNIKKLVSVVFPVILFCSFNNSLNALTKNNIIQALVSGHIAAFSKDNLLTQPIADEDLKKWNDAVNAVNNYEIDTYKQEFEKLQGISNKLIKSLKDNYKNISKAIIKDTAVEKGLAISSDIIKFIDGKYPTDTPVFQELSRQTRGIIQKLNTPALGQFLLPNNALDKSLTDFKRLLNELYDIQFKLLTKKEKEERGITFINLLTEKQKDKAELLGHLTTFLETTLDKIIYIDYPNVFKVINYALKK